MTKKLVIVGAGDYGREVFTWAGQAIAHGAPWELAGFLDDRPDATKGFGDDLRVLGPVGAHVPAENELFLCAIGNPVTKREVDRKLRARGARFATLIHPTALVGRRVQIGEGSILCPFTQLSCDITLGRFVTFGTFSNTAHDTAIGDYTQVSGSCEINGHAVLEEGVFLGSHATILPRARVGSYAYVGAGSVVLRRVRAGVKVFGNPAIPIGPSSDQ